ncbi:phospholipase A2 inhibitor and Ly6/PLAUR domain-containing protein-like [Mastacembelus armatus]|uniref:Phospholipase A2 inhibitor and Ly6/PLAUR domain-containing protein-like n=1 Tax=Mastacembelus armatus TaxID=205130 RepID=A0A7N8X6S4_9TELE|nr:phospholipase A2 inhibitor and Ly6/PLAUR domain-containing protein-like [Mastacembelus armatus]
MKLILSLPLIWTLFSTAGALVCQTCTDTQCSTTAPLTCSTETMCITTSFEATAAGAAVPQTYKACASSSLCPATGFQTLSVSLAGFRAILSAQCCNSDNCNSETLPTPIPQPTNTLQCLTCDATTSQCTSPVQCTGVQDRCFIATMTYGSITAPVLGCASSNLCAAASGLGALPFMQNVGTIISRPVCCGTSLCNSACSVRLVIIHLLLGLLVFTFF